MLKYLNVSKVYLQCGIVIQRVVTKHGLPSVQLSRMVNLKIELQFDLHLVHDQFSLTPFRRLIAKDV